MVRHGWKLDKESSIMFPTQKLQHAAPATAELSFKDQVKDGGEWPAEVPRPTVGAFKDNSTQNPKDGFADVKLVEDRLKELDHIVQRTQALIAIDPSNMKLRRNISFQRSLKDECTKDLAALKKKLEYRCTRG